MEVLSFRLKPGQDLLAEIERIVAENDISAGCILSAVGSLTQATLRLANHETYTTFAGHFEIVAATGTVSRHGSHLHIAISDGEGRTFGGHLVLGCVIYTTAEIVLAVFPHLIYRRELCELSGYEELVIAARRETPSAAGVRRFAVHSPSDD
ncbi:MAG: DNA-binding protein [Anaerolineales bacterium]|nr:DNA-binding protein [Anaerolineales bacterium]